MKKGSEWKCSYSGKALPGGSRLLKKNLLSVPTFQCVTTQPSSQSQQISSRFQSEGALYSTSCWEEPMASLKWWSHTRSIYWLGRCSLAAHLMGPRRLWTLSSSPGSAWYSSTKECTVAKNIIKFFLKIAVVQRWMALGYSSSEMSWVH